MLILSITVIGLLVFTLSTDGYTTDKRFEELVTQTLPEPEETDPLLPPQQPWAVVPAEQMAAAAASYTVTFSPPMYNVHEVAPPYVPLLARLRRRNAGIHPAGANAPARKLGKVNLLPPHLRDMPDLWRRRFPKFVGLPEESATAAALGLETPPPPAQDRLVDTSPTHETDTTLAPRGDRDRVSQLQHALGRVIMLVAASATMLLLAFEAYHLLRKSQQPLQGTSAGWKLSIRMALHRGMFLCFVTPAIVVLVVEASGFVGAASAPVTGWKPHMHHSIGRVMFLFFGSAAVIGFAAETYYMLKKTIGLLKQDGPGKVCIMPDGCKEYLVCSARAGP